MSATSCAKDSPSQEPSEVGRPTSNSDHMPDRTLVQTAMDFVLEQKTIVFAVTVFTFSFCWVLFVL